ncbi:ATPase, T2SS/T4P/T4SS family [Neptuniibacter sp. QD37_11]|uniref:ATPase, T2SS/T4P/T4SS family n=1 Tax=Neptuniibacter sp. QD37_11 TaxID=3398209 RepID=UPI0039F60C87
MTANNNYIIADLAVQLANEQHLNDLLLHLEKFGGSDLFLPSNEPIIASINNQKLRFTTRKVRLGEVESLLQAFYGTHAISKLGDGSELSTSYAFDTEIGGEYKSYRYRVCAIGCHRMEDDITIVFRSIPTTPPQLGDVGLHEDDELVKTFKETKQGVTYVCGATGQGKSTLLAALLRYCAEDPEAHLHTYTIEEPVEFVHYGYNRPTSFFTQIEVGRKIQSFKEGIRTALRMAPQNILVGETRDTETAEATTQASLSGHHCMTTLHANNVHMTFQRLEGFYEGTGTSVVDIVDPIGMIVAQRLIKIEDGTRRALREVLILDQQLKEKLYDAKNLPVEAVKLVHDYGQPFMEDLIKLHSDRLISDATFNEYRRTFDLKKNQGA